MKNNLFRISAILILSFGVVVSSYAGVAVIVHPDNNNQLDERQIRYVFLGKTKTYNDGTKIKTFEFAPGSSARELFIKRVVKKTESNLNSYWARMMFSSKGQPPKEVSSSIEMLKAIASDKAAIGYVDVNDLDDSVKVILQIE